MKSSSWSVRWKSTVGIAAVTLLAGIVPSPWTALHSAEAAISVSGSTPLRVGLMVKSGSYNKTTDTVTLQGRAGLSVGFYSNGAFRSLYEASSAVQTSLDNYFIAVGEYATYNDALAKADQLDNIGLSADIYVETRAGKKVYQLVNGYYERQTQADAVLAKIRSSFGTATLKGYHRLTTGKLSGQQAAEAKANDLRAAGFDAYPLARRDGSYEVWVGNEATAAARDALKASVQAKTGMTLGNADYNPADYVIIKTGTFNGQQVPHVIICSSKEEIAFVPKGSPAVTKVYEKAGLEYRGAMLIQGYNEMPNLINYIPLDQYLYGVLPQEMSTGWPLEALKAQAVAARTYAARGNGSNKWGVADRTDDVWDQAYKGYSIEAADTTQAVNETKGQVLTKNGAMIEAVFSSNNGGWNGDAREMWGSSVDYLTAVQTPLDAYPSEREPLYYRVALPSGKVGWIRADKVSKSGKNAAGFETGTINTDGQPVRPVPDLYAPVAVSAVKGWRVVILGEEREYNTYNWQRGPYSPSDIQRMINGNQAGGYPTVGGPVYDLRVSKWGQGGRMMQITADGKAITAPSPDYYRALFDDMWSTRVTIEQQGTYTVLGANGTKSEYPSAKLKGQTLHVASASGVTSAVNGTNEEFVLVNGQGQNRVAKKNQSYVLHGFGWGHGLGMSQWGAHGMAKNGYTYDRILAHYYQGVTLTPKQ